MPAPPAREAFGQRALRRQLDIQLPVEELPRELLVIAHVGGDHSADPPFAEQQAEPSAVDPAVVRHDVQIRRALVQ